MARWDDSGTWIGEDLRREALFFPSRGVELYGSVYAPTSPSAPLGVVFCNSWGFEGNQAGALVHETSISVAVAGGVAVNFHYPGIGDSYGDLEGATMDVLADAVVDAMREASRRHPDTRWILAGLMLGASVASLAMDRGAQAERLLLVQPALRPRRYFARLERASRRPFGGLSPVEGFAFGYPLSQTMLDSVEDADAAVDAALSRFNGGGTIVRYEKPAEVEGEPEWFERVCAPGTWRFGTRENPALAHATGDWLRQRMAAAR